MKKYFLFAFLTAMSLVASAQTQYGVVKTRGRMVNGVLQPGKGLANATVKVAGKQAVVSQGNNGSFSFPVAGQKYRIENVQKKDYQLVDLSVCTEYKYSENPLRFVMEKPEQQLSDQLTKESNLRRDLQRRLQQSEDEVEKLNVSLEEKNRLLQEINKKREDNERIAKDLSKYYATLDYDQLDEFQRTVTNFLENGQLEQADSMLRSRGDMQSRIIESNKELETAKKKQEIVAEDCYNFYLRFLQAHQNDSAAHYLELRTQLDTTNVEWLNNAGSFIEDYMADYPKAMNYYERGLKQSLSQEETCNWTASFYNNIGIVFLRQNNYSIALEYFLKAQVIWKKIYGIDHPDVAKAYNNIGDVYIYQGDYTKALENLSKALSIQEKILGKVHPDVALTNNNIGYVYYEKGNYSKALKYHLKALEIREAFFGIEHPDVAQSYTNIGSVFLYQGDYEKALESFTKALNIQKEVFGTEHPDVAMSYNNIGSAYYDQKKYDKALSYYLNALSIREKVFGTKHSTVATTYNNIGTVYNYQNDNTKALEYYYKALEIWKNVYGPSHPNVALIYNNIGKIYSDQGDYTKALEYYFYVISIWENVLDNYHPNFAAINNNIGFVYFRQNNLIKALEYYNKALIIYEKAQGKEASSTQAVKKKIKEIQRLLMKNNENNYD